MYFRDKPSRDKDTSEKEDVVEELSADKEENVESKFKDDGIKNKIVDLTKAIEDLDVGLSNSLENYKNVKENRAVKLEIERAVNNALSENNLNVPGQWKRESYQVKEEIRRIPHNESPYIEVNAELRHREPEYYSRSYQKKWNEPNIQEERVYEYSIKKLLKGNPISSVNSYKKEYLSSNYSQRSGGTGSYKPSLRGIIGTDIPFKAYHYRSGY